MIKKSYLFVLLTIILGSIALWIFTNTKTASEVVSILTDDQNLLDDGELDEENHPLSIKSLRGGSYPGSDLFIEETLIPGSNYKRFVASYKSEGLTIYGLLTVPNGNAPKESGWPVVIFNHGYIAPNIYRTTERYVAYQDVFARAGYVTFKSDYRGHGYSEGEAVGAYGSNAYTIDVLNAVSSIKKYPGVNINKIGMWGHSMGGSITLKSMVTTKDVKAGVIWAGVVGSYPDLVERWRRRTTAPQPTSSTSTRGRWRQDLIAKYGEPSQNPEFWSSISANSFLEDISGPLQLHHGTADASVPVKFSIDLESQMKAAKKDVELHTYESDDHNLSKNLSLALRRSVEYFDKYLK